MSYMDWDQKFSVNVKEIDNQHKKLVDMVNELHEAMKMGKGKDIMEKVLAELVNYTASHFATEERLMTQYSYPQFALHKTEHDKLVQQVLSFQKDFNSGKVAITLDLMTFLRDWLANHILGTDKKIGAFLNEKGVA